MCRVLTICIVVGRSYQGVAPVFHKLLLLCVIGGVVAASPTVAYG
jgi:hypothetical protein